MVFFELKYLLRNVCTNVCVSIWNKEVSNNWLVPWEYLETSIFDLKKQAQSIS